MMPNNICLRLLIILACPILFCFDKGCTLVTKTQEETEADALLDQAHSLDRMKLFDSAYDLCRRAIDIASKYGRGYLEIARCEGDRNELDRAIIDASTAIDLQSDFDSAYNLRGYYYTRKTRYDLAIADLSKAISINSEFAWAYSNRADAYANSREWESALKDLSKTIDLLPDSGYAYKDRAFVYAKMNLFKSALSDYKKAAGLDPTDADAVIGIAYVQGYMKNYKEAFDQFRQAQTMGTPSVYFYFDRGFVYSTYGDCSKAIQDYSKAIELDPSMAVAYFNRAQAEQRIQRFDEAIADMDKAIELDKDRPADDYANRGIIYQAMGEYKRAIEDFKASLRVDPQNIYALAHIQASFIRLADFDNAATYYTIFENSESRRHNDTAFFFYDTYLKTASDDVRKGSYDEALRHLESAESEYAHSSVARQVDSTWGGGFYTDVLALKGFVLEKLGLHSGAGVAYRQALLFNGLQPDVREGLDRLQGMPEGPGGPGRDNAGAPAIAASTYCAILIGEDNYSDQRLQPLQKPIADAAELRDLLIRDYSFLPDNITSLNDKSREEILQAITSKCNSPGGIDNLLIFYSGHGKELDDGKGYLIPSSANLDNRFTFISMNDLITAIGNHSNIRHILFITDACYSGALFKGGASEMSDDVQTVYRDFSRRMMTSGNREAVPDNSVFNTYFIRYLQENTKNYLTADDLFRQIKLAVMHSSRNTPRYEYISDTGDEGGDFVFMRK